jgi:hypothetical protein
MSTYSIELETFESVVPGGVRRVTWLIQRDERWLVASDVPGARVEQRDVGPKMVWLRTVTVALAPGSRLVRVDSTPRRAAPRDPLAYLFGPAPKRTRQTRRSHFVVNAAGTLERVPPWHAS